MRGEVEEVGEMKGGELGKKRYNEGWENEGRESRRGEGKLLEMRVISGGEMRAKEGELW